MRDAQEATPPNISAGDRHVLPRSISLHSVMLRTVSFGVMFPRSS